MSEPVPRDYPELLGDIKERIRSAQYEALRMGLIRLGGHLKIVG